MRFANQEAYQNYQSSGMDATGGGKGAGGGYGGSRAIPARIDVRDVYNALQGYQQRLDRNNPIPQPYLQPATSTSALGSPITPSTQTISPVVDVAQQPMQADLTNTTLPTNTSVVSQPRSLGENFTPNPYTIDPVRPVQGLTPTSTTMGGGK